MRKDFILPGRNEMKNGTNDEADNTKSHERDVPDDSMEGMVGNFCRHQSSFTDIIPLHLQ